MKAAGKGKQHPLLAFHSALLILFIYVPVLMIIIYSFNDSRINSNWSGFTLKWYGSLFDNRQVMEALGNSLSIAVISTVVSTIFGTMAALALRRMASRKKQGVVGLLYLPIIVPDIIMGLSLLVLFSQFQIPLGKLTVIIAHITFSISYVYVIVSSRLANMGKQLEEAASDLGASPWQTFRFVTLPSIWPGVLAGAIMAFTLSIDDFMISFFVAGPNSTTLPIYIYGLVKRGISPEINALCTLMIIVSVALIVLAQWLLNRGNGNERSSMLPF
ncbi:ABC transporter permease [Paenibacillus apiarius]|uniref:ABC transporter permease n=1 Tax=Paenibacillus apiarius TaxID=46240 RepID=A0ABT4DTC1_9BACL|nr:ABC transporter permease [Paenibacillus apiarius]MBN3524481.1 ABC transporter permease [Paenibacillus apiarius]MCY9515286.1 ABC transporter permease [Paenibacillus apiarius]MCY9520035.1 ABC transporter permease [Paenibacillus apiarius]MCY9554342.1 ABC transporter permease [Paenibacillus apiarius]MCY9558133.1 ABC transporter permease [Paenibacillus apiarius]